MAKSKFKNLDTDTTLGGNNASDEVIASQKAIKSYTDNGLSGKQETLVSGTNIKTINNESILGSGNISISGGSTTDVQVNGTSITSNGVANLVTNTAYNSSSNKIATMSDIPASEVFTATYGTTTFADVLTAYNSGKTLQCYVNSSALYPNPIKTTSYQVYIVNSQVYQFQFYIQIDENNYEIRLKSNNVWNFYTTSLAKTSTLSTVATSGSYNDLSNKPTIPDAQVQANWNETNTSSKAYIQNKPTIPTVPTNVSAFTNDAGYTTNVGTVTSVNSVSPVNGNVSLTIPTNTNQLTNGAGFITSSDLSGYQLIAQDMTGLGAGTSYSLTDNSINRLTTTINISFSLPLIASDTTKFHQIFVQLYMPTAKTINLGTSYYFNKKTPDMSTAGMYNIIYEYDNANRYWVVGVIPKGAAS